MALTLLVACGGDPPTPVQGCEPRGGLAPVCGFQNPEDLVVLPDGDALLVSQYAHPGQRGSLVWYGLGDGSRRELYPDGALLGQDDIVWGQPDCPGPPGEAFAPHGIDLEYRTDGRLQLLVVNHGGRESVEFFEVLEADPVRLLWRGCVVPPFNSNLNDVVGLRGGGFLTTHMYPRSGEFTAMVKGVVLRKDTGHVFEWTPSSGFRVVAGTDAPFPNGIEKSPDERYLYLNAYMADEVRRIDRLTGSVVGVAEVPLPDNLSWSLDGHLLVASHTGGLTDLMGCTDPDAPPGSCTLAFQILVLDPESLASATVIDHIGPPMAAASVAVQAGDDLWLGSFAGDRIARFMLPDGQLPNPGADQAAGGRTTE